LGIFNEELSNFGTRLAEVFVGKVAPLCEEVPEFGRAGHHCPGARRLTTRAHALLWLGVESFAAVWRVATRFPEARLGFGERESVLGLHQPKGAKIKKGEKKKGCGRGEASGGRESLREHERNSDSESEREREGGGRESAREHESESESESVSMRVSEREHKREAHCSVQPCPQRGSGSGAGGGPQPASSAPSGPPRPGADVQYRTAPPQHPSVADPPPCWSSHGVGSNWALLVQKEAKTNEPISRAYEGAKRDHVV
jgi:hypothetical protein